jgi:hypothetical protein
MRKVIGIHCSADDGQWIDQGKLAVISYREDYLMLRVRVLPHQV